MLFTERPFLDRFSAAAASRFQAIEVQFPYTFHADQIADKLNLYQLDLILHNLPAGNWEAGDRGIACDPGRIGEFQDGVREGIQYARELGVKKLNCLAGIVPPGLDRFAAYDTLVRNLQFASDKLRPHDIALLIEPVNTYDVPGFFLSRTDQALDVIRDTQRDNIFIQFDIYHMQRMEGELAATISSNLSRIAHIQIADNPGRNEPGSGEISFPFLFDHLDRLGYQGWIGCEYKPSKQTEKTLSFMMQHSK